MKFAYSIILLPALLLLAGCQKDTSLDGPELNTNSSSNTQVLISDFETGSLSDIATTQIQGSASFGIVDGESKPVGSKVCNVSGTVGSGYYVGQINFVAPKWAGDTNQVVFPVPAGASETYINFYMYGNVDDGDTYSLIIQSQEDEDLDGKISSYNTQLTPSKEDFYTYTIDVSWTGWKLIRIPYSNMSIASDSWGGTGGNKIHDPDKIHILAFILITPPGGNQANIKIDNLILTTGEPYSQSN